VLVRDAVMSRFNLGRVSSSKPTVVWQDSGPHRLLVGGHPHGSLSIGQLTFPTVRPLASEKD